jgi:hypothetical protein
MADKKISALTASTTPLAGTEVLPIVQGGSTVKVAVSDLTAGRAITATQLTLSTENLVIGTTAKGITTGSSIPLGFGVNNTITAMTINTSSNVGIGTPSPITRLHLSQANSGGHASVILLSNSADAAGDRTGIYGSPSVGAANAYRGGITFSPGNTGAVSIHTGNNALPSDGQAMLFAGTGSRDVTISTGNFIIGAAGKGIDFSANTNAAGMTSELLNWYEEGTWTPTVTVNSGTATGYTISNSVYTRIGREVTVKTEIIPTGGTFGNGTGYCAVAGLPFTSSGYFGGLMGNSANVTADQGAFAFTQGGTILYILGNIFIPTGDRSTLQATYFV